jgi:DNA-damage-inducible protein D
VIAVTVRRTLRRLSVSDIKARKGIAANDDLLDCAGRVELAMNEFKITQAEEKLIRDKVRTEAIAIQVHRDVGAEVRAAVRRPGVTIPVYLPAETNITK